jgi:hypothetical protein
MKAFHLIHAGVTLLLLIASLVLGALIFTGVLEIRPAGKADRHHEEPIYIETVEPEGTGPEKGPVKKFIHVFCPHCDRRLRVRLEDGGTEHRCPLCGKTFTAPKVSP